MQNLDHPSMILVMILLTNNFLTWSISIRRALVAKNILGFISGGVEEPIEEPNHSKWRRVDEMVTSWIINSMKKEIDVIFIYCTSVRRLWIELEEQFGESNGPWIYQIQRQIASVEQGNFSVAIYYSILKKLWEELNVLQPLPWCNCVAMNGCVCDASNGLLNIISQNKIQFLIGLNASYDRIRSKFWF